MVEYVNLTYYIGIQMQQFCSFSWWQWHTHMLCKLGHRFSWKCLQSGSCFATWNWHIWTTLSEFVMALVDSIVLNM